MRGSCLAAAFLLYIGAAAPASADAKGDKAKVHRVTAPVAFQIELSKASYTRNEPITITVSLKNTGGKPVWVNTRFYANSPSQPPEDREVTFEVTGPDGKPLSCTFNYPTGLPKSDYFQQLAGGHTISAEHPSDLRTYFQFAAPGRYTITGVYENVFGPEIGLAAFTGPATSKPVTLTITE